MHQHYRVAVDRQTRQVGDELRARDLGAREFQLPLAAQAVKAIGQVESDGPEQMLGGGDQTWWLQVVNPR